MNKLMDKLMDKPIGKAITKLIDKLIVKPMGKAMTRLMDQLMGKPITKSMDKPDISMSTDELIEQLSIDHETGTAPHLFFMATSILCVAFAVWSFYGTLDIISIAVGRVVPSSQIKTVQHLEGGIIKEIMVREGETVARGQALVKLAATASRADVEELKTRLRSLELDIIRLQTEASGEQELSLDTGADVPYRLLAVQAIELYQARQDRLKSALVSQEEIIVQQEQQVAIMKTRIRQGKITQGLLNEQVAMSEDLISQELSSRFVHVGLLKERAAVTLALEESRSERLKSEAALRQAKSDLAGITHAYNQEVRAMLDDRRTKHAEFSERLRKYADSLTRTTVRSPVDGVVKTLYVVTEGGVVPPGGFVLDIVPGDDRLVIEAQLPTQDVGYVSQGQDAYIRLASADAERFDRLLAKVDRISPDSLVTEDGFPYYKISIISEKSFFEDGNERYNLFPGMSVIAHIQTGQRTVLAYLLQPFWKSADVALSER